MNQNQRIGNWELYEEISTEGNINISLVKYVNNNQNFQSKKWKMTYTSVTTDQIQQDSDIYYIINLNDNYNKLISKNDKLPLKPKGSDGYAFVTDGDNTIFYFVVEELDYTLEKYLNIFKNVGFYEPISMIYLIGSYLLDTISDIAHTKNIIANINPEIFMLKHGKDKIFLTDFNSISKYEANESYESYDKDQNYTSVSTDLNDTITYKDNVESIMYIIFYLIYKLNGEELPWYNDITIKQNIDQFNNDEFKEIIEIINICKKADLNSFNTNYDNHIKHFQHKLSTKYAKYLTPSNKNQNSIPKIKNNNIKTPTPNSTPKVNQVVLAKNQQKNAENQRIEKFVESKHKVGLRPPLRK